MTKYFLFDTETGGFPEKNTSLLTLSGKLLNSNLKVLDKIDLKIKPRDGVYKIEPRALEINKIDLVKHHKEATPEHEAAELFMDFITRNNLGSDRIFPMGHNVSFDVAFMIQLVGAKRWHQHFDKKIIDTACIAEFLCLARVLPPSNETNCSLEGLAERFGFSYEGAHDADFDTILTLKVLKCLMNLVRERTSN